MRNTVRTKVAEGRLKHLEVMRAEFTTPIETEIYEELICDLNSYGELLLTVTTDSRQVVGEGPTKCYSMWVVLVRQDVEPSATLEARKSVFTVPCWDQPDEVAEAYLYNELRFNRRSVPVNVPDEERQALWDTHNLEDKLEKGYREAAEVIWAHTRFSMWGCS